jgi:type II secretory pathway component PulF
MRRDLQATEPPKAPQSEDHLHFETWEERYSFCLSIAIMVEAGVKITDAIEQQGQTFRAFNKKKSAGVCDSLTFRVSSGQRIDMALADMPRAFPKHIQRMVSAGFSVGRLNTAFYKAAEVERKAQKAKKETREMLRYPLIILSLGLIVGLVLLDSFAALLPLFESSNNDFVPYVQGALALMQTLQSPLFLTILLGALVFVGLRFWRDERLRRDLGNKWHHIFRNLPGLKNLMTMNSNVQFCYIMAQQISTGVPITTALEPALLVANDPLFDELSSFSKTGFKSYSFLRWIFRLFGLSDGEPKRGRETEIEKCMRENGDSLGEALERYPDQFLPQVVAMVKLGEECAFHKNPLTWPFELRR